MPRKQRPPQRTGRKTDELPYPVPETLRRGGACLGMDVNLFFDHDPHSQARAKVVCKGCPIVEQCLEYAMDVRERDGVWGGLTAKEREGLRKQRRTKVVVR